MSSCFVVRLRLDDFRKTRLETLNGDKSCKDKEYITSLRMQREFVRALDDFICGLISRWWSLYGPTEPRVRLDDTMVREFQDRWDGKWNFQSQTVVAREKSTQRLKYQLRPADQTDPILRITFVRIATQLELRTNLYVSHDTQIKNTLLRIISHDILVPVVQRYLDLCITDANDARDRKSRCILLTKEIGIQRSASFLDIWPMPSPADDEHQQQLMPLNAQEHKE